MLSLAHIHLAGSFGALLVGWLVVVVRGLYLARHLFTLSFIFLSEVVVLCSSPVNSTCDCVSPSGYAITLYRCIVVLKLNIFYNDLCVFSGEKRLSQKLKTSEP